MGRTSSMPCVDLAPEDDAAGEQGLEPGRERRHQERRRRPRRCGGAARGSRPRGARCRGRRGCPPARGRPGRAHRCACPGRPGCPCGVMSASSSRLGQRAQDDVEPPRRATVHRAGVRRRRRRADPLPGRGGGALAACPGLSLTMLIVPSVLPTRVTRLTEWCRGSVQPSTGPRQRSTRNPSGGATAQRHVPCEAHAASETAQPTARPRRESRTTRAYSHRTCRRRAGVPPHRVDSDGRSDAGASTVRQEFPHPGRAMQAARSRGITMILRDPIHGLVAFESEEDAIVTRLLATREVQRLRRIRQLGLTSFAFPGAEHTRFAHAVGAAHVMQLFLGAAAPGRRRAALLAAGDQRAGARRHRRRVPPRRRARAALAPLRGRAARRAQPRDLDRAHPARSLVRGAPRPRRRRSLPAPARGRAGARQARAALPGQGGERHLRRRPLRLPPPRRPRDRRPLRRVRPALAAPQPPLRREPAAGAGHRRHQGPGAPSRPSSWRGSSCSSRCTSTSRRARPSG